jgi:hypothetical protein
METQELIFAETRGKAKQSSEAYSESGDWLTVRAIRKPEFDKHYEQGYVPKSDLLADGWWFECYGKTAEGKYCSKYLTESDKPLIRNEKT